MAALDLIIEKVTAQSTVVSSIVTLLNELAAQLVECQADPAKVAEIAAQIQANTDALAAAVQANTPVPVEPPSPPTE